ncbi:hypothetical protein FZC74_00965 [Sutcliffiella horikoshii]|uniref:Uncharacterized protein n=1 Tax=Sutcliffiella horikoshii TaxID=79883 RepID=A0AA94WQF1_9BACI|nr:hypothetical protein FZC74_00965 [Sutcliffiella horikoshii]
MRPGRRSLREAHGPPAGKRSAWNGNRTDYILSTEKNTTGKVVFCKKYYKKRTTSVPTMKQYMEK